MVPGGPSLRILTLKAVFEADVSFGFFYPIFLFPVWFYAVTKDEKSRIRT